MAGFAMISFFWMSLMTSFNPVYSKGCLWKNYTTLHPGEGLASSDITDKIQNHGCINECVRTDNEVYVIAQVESGNNDLVRVVIKADGRWHPNCRMSYKLILLSINRVDWAIEHIGNNTQFKLSEVHIYDLDEDGAKSGVTGEGNARVNHTSMLTASNEWNYDYMDFLKRFIHLKGLFKEALSINVGEYPSTWKLTVNGTCCSNTTTSVWSTSTRTSSLPPHRETSTSSTKDGDYDYDTAADDDDDDDDKKRNTALVVSLVVVSVVLVVVFIVLFCYCLHKKNKTHEGTTQARTEHRHRHHNPDIRNHRQPVSDQRYVHNTRSPTPNDRVYYEEAAAVIPPQIPSRANRP